MEIYLIKVSPLPIFGQGPPKNLLPIFYVPEYTYPT